MAEKNLKLAERILQPVNKKKKHGNDHDLHKEVDENYSKEEI